MIFTISNCKNKNKGIALIYVLLIFSMITLMASKIMSNLWLHTEKNSKFIEKIQAKHYALSAEQYIASLMEIDNKKNHPNNPNSDHLKNILNLTSVNFDINELSIKIKVIDENSKFNLNWLALNELDGKHSFQYLLLLLQNLGLNHQIAYNIKDWIDTDQISTYDEAEDDYYLSLTPSRRAANQPLISITELLMIKGISMEDYQLILPFISTLPKESLLNINSAPAEVLQTISEKLTINDAKRIVEYREQQPFKKLSDLTLLPELMDKTADLKKFKFTFTGQFFNIHMKINYRDSVLYMRSLLSKNDNGKIQVLERELDTNYFISSNKNKETI